MRHIILLTFLFLSTIAFSQVNEAAPSLYKWKGSKTAFQSGYIVLKSGKMIQGQISLRGKPDALKEIVFIEKEKEMKFPLTAIKAYGLGTERPNPNSKKPSNINSGPICDNNENLFVWRDMGEQMGKKISNTKPRNGYVVTYSGKRHEGDLQLKKVDGKLDQFKIKTEEGKFKLEPSEVSNYGLSMTIEELTKGGKKDFNDEARNFHPGTVKLKNGQTLNGFIAFRKKVYINANKPGMGYKYMGIFFAEKEKDYLKTYPNEALEYVSQNVNGESVNYSPYDGGFVSANEMDKVKFVDDLKELNPGTLVLANGTKLLGSIAKIDKKALNYKSNEGVIKKYAVEEVERFDVEIDGEKRSVINLENELTEELFKGDKFWAYINPNPTHVNERKTSLAQGLTTTATSATGAIIMNEDQKKNDYDFKIDSIIMNSSLAELKTIQEGLWKIHGVSNSDEMQEVSTNESAKKMDFSLGLAIAGKEASESIKVYYEEIILVNKLTNEKYVLYNKKKDLNQQLEGLLMGCYTFLSMDKKEQKSYYDLDNISKTAAMLNECY